jgi:hypothetical protein
VRRCGWRGGVGVACRCAADGGGGQESGDDASQVENDFPSSGHVSSPAFSSMGFSLLIQLRVS